MQVVRCVVPSVATFHALCFFLDPILFPGLRRVEVRTPVFIVGHARSGTTLLHRLLSKDAARFSAFLLYELFFPSLLQKKAQTTGTELRNAAKVDYLDPEIKKAVEAEKAAATAPAQSKPGAAPAQSAPPAKK